jgi:predicted  nucleic acid-binding Zn-ribbon protein
MAGGGRAHDQPEAGPSGTARPAVAGHSGGGPMSAFEVVLEIQESDMAADRLRHRRETLAERAELASVEERLEALESRLAAARARHAVVAERQAKLEAEAAALDRRIGEIDRRLYSGTVSASRELLAMSAEIDSLRGLCTSVENDALAAMEEAEPLAARAALGAEADRLRAAIVEAESVIDDEVAAQERVKAGMVGSVPVELLARYERLRAQLGGIGAARLVGSSCSGCHLTLPMSELARIKKRPLDELVFCDQCGRILVR